MLKWNGVKRTLLPAGCGQQILRRGLACLLLCCLLLASPAHAETTTLTFSFAGDVTLGCDEDWWDDDRAFPNVAEPQGYDYPFAKVQHLFAADDLTIVNLEGVLQDDAEGIAAARKYNFRGPTHYTGFLTHGSIEAVTLGNNHAMDFRQSGLASTQAALDAAGIGWMHNDTPFIFEKDGIKVAFLGYLQDAYHDRLPQMTEIIRHLKEDEGCAAVVLNLHIGVEYAPEHHRTQRISALQGIESGADLVIMHHPHVIQGIDQFHNRYVVYSLGNFCFGGNRSIKPWHRPSLVAVATLTFEDGRYAGQQLTLHPMHCTGTAGNNYQPCPVTGEAALEVMELVDDDTDLPLPDYREGEGVVLPYLAAKEE